MAGDVHPMPRRVLVPALHRLCPLLDPSMHACMELAAKCCMVDTNTVHHIAQTHRTQSRMLSLSMWPRFTAGFGCVAGAGRISAVRKSGASLPKSPTDIGSLRDSVSR
jgi:hypothetical protein